MIEPGLEDINSALGTLITNASSLQSRQQQHLSHVFEWARALNIDPDATFSLHVAGTKGKGSVCAYSEKVLRSAGLKTGLFTSPHLMSVRERFRINGAAIDSEDFKRIFWDVWGRMKQQQQQQQQERDLDSSGALSELPAYFRFLTLLGFAAFKRLDVDVSIIEVGLGGRLDATNIMSAPVACCITSLGMDHMAVLGSTLDKIAFEKAGILKPGVPCVLTPQKPVADAVVVARADVVSCSIYRSAVAFSQNPQLVQLLQQQQPVVAENMTAAVVLAALAAIRLPLTTVSKSPRLLEWRQQLELCVPGAESLAIRWPGRMQIVQLTSVDCWHHSLFSISSSSSLSSPTSSSSAAQPSATPTLPPSTIPSQSAAPSLSPSSPVVMHPESSSSLSFGFHEVPFGNRCTLYLDGAHTDESLAACGRWYESCVSGSTSTDSVDLPPPARILLFNCSADRDPSVLLPALLFSMTRPFDIAIFCVPDSSRAAAATSVETAHEQHPEWQLRQANVFACLLQNSTTSRSHSMCAQGPLNEENAFDTDALANGVAAGKSRILVRVRIADALRVIADASHRAQQTGASVHILCTGSLYLVGDTLSLLPQAREAAFQI